MITQDDKSQSVAEIADIPDLMNGSHVIMDGMFSKLFFIHLEIDLVNS